MLLRLELTICDTQRHPQLIKYYNKMMPLRRQLHLPGTWWTSNHNQNFNLGSLPY